MRSRASDGPNGGTAPLCQSGWSSRLDARKSTSLGQSGQSRGGPARAGSAGSKVIIVRWILHSKSSCKIICYIAMLNVDIKCLGKCGSRRTFGHEQRNLHWAWRQFAEPGGGTEG